MIAVLEECKLVCQPSRQNPTTVRCLIKIRKTFYNQALFETDEPVALAQAVSGAAPWWDFVLNFMMAMAILVSLLYFLPGVISRYWPQFHWGGEAEVMAETVARASVYDEVDLLAPPAAPVSEGTHKVQPAYDLTLPEGRWVISEKAGIRAPIYTNDTIEDKATVNELLDQGIYLYPEYNNIGWQGKRVILAGHHYNMSVNSQKSVQSFQNLEQLEVGDVIQVVDDYKIWNYEIYKIERSTEITETDPDLMMYTCIYWWDAKLRLFVYGRIVE